MQRSCNSDPCYATAMSNKLKGLNAVSKTVRDNAQSGIVLGDPQSQQIFAIRKNELCKERGMAYVYENGGYSNG